MSKDNKKIAPERIKVPCYGDEKIEEAKGKFTPTKFATCTQIGQSLLASF